MNSGRILIIEDDEGIAFLQTETLDKLGYDCTSVATGAAALEEYRRNQ